jgi:hypothetical protein
MFSAVHPITDLGTAEGIVIRRAILDADCDCTAANPRSPAAPLFDLKRQFKFEFNNYLRSALTLRRVSSRTRAQGLQIDRMKRTEDSLRQKAPPALPDGPANNQDPYGC